uniref:Uncharacterized protein n=1 Tax=Anolis carolinensis TaxID=28377 RepID=A0A803TYA2_ANOCA
MRKTTTRTSCALLLISQVNSIHPECRFFLELEKDEIRCMELLRNAKTVGFKGKNIKSGLRATISPSFCVPSSSKTAM